MIGAPIADALNVAIAQTENFQDVNGTPNLGRVALVSFLTLLAVFALILFFGQYLWNNVLTALIPGVKPAKSIWQILGLAILISLLHPGCVCPSA